MLRWNQSQRFLGKTESPYSKAYTLAVLLPEVSMLPNMIEQPVDTTVKCLPPIYLAPPCLWQASGTLAPILHRKEG